MNDQRSLTRDEIYGPNVEDQAFGKWFPRVGALAIVLGAGFGFKYAIDQGWIGARLRVLLGLLSGFALITIGDWTRRREWSAYASAITGGGVGLLYLTLWASVEMYHLIPSSAAFFCLIGVSGLGVALALRHDSQALALISLIGGFMNPFVTGMVTDMPEGLYLYTLAIDLAVVVLGFFRPWRLLQQVAFVSSWIVFEIGDGPFTVSLVAATGVFLMFGVLPYVRAAVGRRSDLDELTFVPINGLIYYFAVFARLDGDLESYRGIFTLAMAGTYVAAFLFLRIKDVGDHWLNASTGLMSFVFLTAWSPIQLGVDLMALGWAIQAVILLTLFLGTKQDVLRSGGWVVLIMSATTHLALTAPEPASSVADDYGRFVFILVIAGLYLGAYTERYLGWNDQSLLASLAASCLTLFWLSLEVYSSLSHEGRVTPAPADLHLGLSAAWALYAGALLTVGIYFRLRPARLMSLGIFGGTVIKMAIHDLWLLDTLQRLIGFVGLGCLLLASSLLYHRFRSLLDQNPTSGGG